jgi:uncharacterized protein YuzE
MPGSNYIYTPNEILDALTKAGDRLDMNDEVIIDINNNGMDKVE